MAALTIENLYKSFGATEVIRGVSLSAQSGEFVVFVGPSGCGKSTLLRLIAGLERSASGSIRIGERDVTGVDPAKRGIAMVFQTYALYPHMSVAENMGFGLEMAGMAKPEREKLVRQAAEMLHLTDYLDRKPRQLSGGQRQRVAIGRAIVRNPDIFLFDEPLSNLDAELRVRMRLEIAKLHRDLGATMVYVTHDQVEAMTLADRIVVLRAGLVEQIGSPMQLYSDPDNRFVAGFIGSPRMNFVEATVTGMNDGAMLLDVAALGLSGLSIRPRVMPETLPATVTLGVRPEHLAEGGEGAVAVSLPCTAIERLGSIAYLYTAPGDDATIIAQLRGASAASPGSAVEVRLDPAQCFLFDAGGNRI
ncbi:ABC transporter ATP-binding protein [Mesorhizobium microcysteis]|uniref:ABC transporter ATP-binding protein n=1 Tax=Neoaquamicrobium microcysteis TaxID=2682781 RepID=A0A5D4GR96_9HYPH|nr:ABC transporter ATP-binding protein [Mesorhizobium microcysteis]TYR30562.1 ABC transporter ATP-binding protein [Mesorhizobium microcysteis]